MTFINSSELPRRSWTEVAAAKRAIRDQHITKHRSTKDDQRCEHSITDIADVNVLTEAIHQGKLSAEEVVRAYINRACEAQTNCLTEICFDDAIAQAKALDNFQQQNGCLIGPLHGVVMTLKDQFNIAGLDSTLGYVGRVGRPAHSDALLAQILKQLGAIIIAKTNLPQSILWCETDNPLWGLTTHPLNAKLTPGGSTGGEAALLALHGSMVGWGTDIGGSIRIPSHMNGLYGFKPSAARISYQGCEVSQAGQQHVASAIGPMARSLTSLTTVTKLIIEAQPWTLDSQLPPLPWREDVFQTFSERPLVIGIMPDDGTVKVHPPILRIFNSLVAKLSAAGHEILEWDTPSLNAECISIMDTYYTVDGGEDLRCAVMEGGEPFIPHVQSLINRTPAISVYEYWQLNKRKIAAQQKYFDTWSQKCSPISGRPMDILLAPVMPHTAVPHRSCRWVGYTKMWNFLDYTALCFPAGKVSKELDEDPEESKANTHEPRNAIEEFTQSLFDINEMDGLPVGLQIVGRRYEEEKVLGAAQQVEHLLK